jgi:hypothetical protein
LPEIDVDALLDKPVEKWFHGYTPMGFRRFWHKTYLVMVNQLSAPVNQSLKQERVIALDRTRKDAISGMDVTP